MKINSQLRKAKQIIRRVPKPALFVTSFAIIGVVVLIVSRAATPFVSLEPEQGIKTNNASVISDDSASSGSAVRFNVSSAERTCSGEFPDGSCTGVPAGTSLTVQNGDLHITQANAVIDAKDIRGCVYVEAENATIKRSKISGCTGSHQTVVRNNNNQVLIEDVEIDGGRNDGNVDLAGVGGSNVTCRRCNIHSLTKGAHFDASNYVFEYSWVHDLYMPGTDNSHGEAIYTDYTSNGVIRGNNLDSYAPANAYNNSASLAVYNLYGGHNNLLIENNLFNADASFCVYVGYIHTSSNPLTNVRVLNNKFGRKYHQNCAYYGAVTGGSHGSMDWGGASGNQWSGNTYTDGVVIPAP